MHERWSERGDEKDGEVVGEDHLYPEIGLSFTFLYISLYSLSLPESYSLDCFIIFNEEIGWD